MLLQGKLGGENRDGPREYPPLRKSTGKLYNSIIVIEHNLANLRNEVERNFTDIHLLPLHYLPARSSDSNQRANLRRVLMNFITCE